MKRTTFVLLIIALILIADQVLKIWVKTHLNYGDEFGIIGLNWARIHFVENEGMAFGIELGGEFGKLALSLFRLLAVAFLIYILRDLIKGRATFGLLMSFSLILAGAIGNIIDSSFYGLIFSESKYHGGLAEMMPEGGGYAPLLFGKVVDMLYFPLIDAHWPEWVPWIGGNRFQFFKPVFNIADAAISTGVITMLLFHRKFLQGKVEAPAHGQNEGTAAVAMTATTSETNTSATFHGSGGDLAPGNDAQPPDRSEDE